MRLNDKMEELLEWLKEASTLRVDRPWCDLGVEELSQAGLNAAFDKKELEDLHEERYNEFDPQKKRPHAFLQTELNLLYSMHKAACARHKTRLQVYRDDSAQKGFHTRRTVRKALRRFTGEQSVKEES